YKALANSSTRTLGLKAVKKATKLRKDELMAAYGWLAREGKIVLTNNDDELVATLTD
ncbi:MAG: winged helix-turn-helix domain-containing protein, partial [Muribaculaceae bacterium]|nr:winged helix-turn-helix domain-containing protein [Muribaculaceae bacterium]